MTKVLFINGPPGAGKDEAGEFLADIVPDARVAKMANPLKRGTHALFMALTGQLSPATVVHAMQPNAFEHSKDTPTPMALDLSWREAYIAVSEQLLKGLFGREIFGQILAAEIMASPEVPLWLITDSGFDYEATPVIQAVGAENCTLMRAHRPGHDFAQDSRSYIDLSCFGIETVDVQNDGDLGVYFNRLRVDVLPKAL